MKQIVAQAALASLVGAAVGAGFRHLCFLAEMEVRKTLPRKLFGCLFRHCHACWWRAWRIPGRIIRLFSGYPPPPPPSSPSYLSSHIQRCGALALSKSIGCHPLHAVSLAPTVHLG